MAPGLRDCLRKVLEFQKRDSEEIFLYMKNISSLTRYDSAFKKWFVILQALHKRPEDCSVADATAALLKLSEI